MILTFTNIRREIKSVLYIAVITLLTTILCKPHFVNAAEFDTIESISINSENNSNHLAVNKSLKLSASVEPESADSGAIIWTSSDDSIAVVNNGVVTALSSLEDSETKVTISCHSNNDEEVYASFDLYIYQGASSLTINAPNSSKAKVYSDDTVLLYISDDDSISNMTYDLSDEWVISPSDSCDVVEYRSSNPSVITVDDSGIVTAVGSGNAYVTVEVADGSKVKDSINFKCVTPISSMEIKSKNGMDYVIGSKSLYPCVVFNGGKSMPDNTSLEWSIIKGSEYFTIDKKSGRVTAKANSYLNSDVFPIAATIRAESSFYDISEDYSFDIYKATEKISDKLSSVSSQIHYFQIGSHGNINSYFNVAPSIGCKNDYSYKSSDSSVLLIDEYTGDFSALSAGKATVYVTANDGSLKSLSFRIVVCSEEDMQPQLVNKSGYSSIYPGKSILYEVRGPHNSIISKDSIEWSFIDSNASESLDGLLSISRGTIKVNITKAQLEAFDGYEEGKEYKINARIKSGDGDIDLTSSIYLYTAGISEIVLADKEIVLDEIGSKYNIIPTSKPDSNYVDTHGGYLYSTSNIKAARVYTDGTVEATGNGSAVITVKANDGSGKTARLKVSVAQKVTSITVKSKTGRNFVASGKTLQLNALVNSLESENKAAKSSVKWSIEDMEGNPSLLASVSSTGALKASFGISEKCSVVAVAKATDGTIVRGQLTIDIYPLASRIGLYDYTTSQEVAGKIILSTCLIKDGEDIVIPKEYDFTSVILPESACQDVSVISSAPGIVSVNKTADNKYTLSANKKGRATITVSSLDGSNKNNRFTVEVISPITSLKVYSKSKITEVKAGKTLQLGALSEQGNADSYVNYEIISVDGIKLSEASAEQLAVFKTIASIDSRGKLKAGNGSSIGSSYHKVYVKAISKDPLGTESLPIVITVCPDNVPVKYLRIVSQSGEYSLGGGNSVQVKAVTNSDAANKKIQWSISKITDKDGNYEPVSNNIASISLLGMLKAGKDVNSIHKVTVKCKALDGSEVYAERTFIVYPKIVSLKVESTPVANVSSVIKNSSVTLKCRALGMDEQYESADRPHQKYKVVYTTGSAKVYLNNDLGNSVTVYGYKKGSCLVTFTALDGSGKTASYKLNIIEGEGWTTINGHKYYVDATTGKVATGFRVIDGKLYYFNETKENEGAMAIGLFTVPNLGQAYYDTAPKASNRYYADNNGVVLQENGWHILKKEFGISDSQKWSYYLYDNSRNIGSEEIEGLEGHLCGEIVLGDIIINDDTSVTYVDSISDVSSDKLDSYYSLNAVTGARDKKVLYFYGNYHGESIGVSQINTMKSIAIYINSDEKCETASDSMIYVNSEEEVHRKRLWELGLTKYDPASVTFPKAASSHIEDEDFGYEEDGTVKKNKYVVANDIAKWDDINNCLIEGSDGNVDVYDVELYSKDVYKRAIAKYGANNLVLAGASSGAGTVLALCQYAAKEGLAQPSQVYLLSPWVDMSMTNEECKLITPNLSSNTDVDTLKYWGARYTRDGNYKDSGSGLEKYAVNNCAGPGVNYEFASPLRGSFEGLSSKYYIYTGKYDPCMPDTKLSVNKLTQSGVTVEFSNYPASRHGFMFDRGNHYAEVVLDMATNIMTE